MNLTEKRNDAAHTLVVPYDATPDVVDAAYERRVNQRFIFDINDKETHTRSLYNLYNARVRMKQAPNRQWLAQLKLFLTPSTDKMQHVLQTQLKTMHKDSTDKIEAELLQDLLNQLKKIGRTYNMLRGIVAYNLTGLGSMMIYDHVSPKHGPIVPMIVYGSMLIAGFVLGFTMDSLDKKRKVLCDTFDALTLWRFIQQSTKEK